MQEYLYQTADARDCIRQRMQETIRQRTQESLYQTVNAGYLHQTADAGVSLSESGCRRLSIRQWVQESLYPTTDAGVFP